MRLRALFAGLFGLLSVHVAWADRTPSAAPTAAEAVARLADLDDTINKALADQKVPGVSVAVVVDDQVVLLQGYGLRNIENNLPMTPDTMMPIASITKQFTVAGLATLVRAGKLEWDKPVRDFMPDFRLGNDDATLRATPRDLVTHRIGMPRHDAVWFGSTLNREAMHKRLQHLDFAFDLRTRFLYNNFMYMEAGYLAGRIAGKTWEEFTKEALFTPLGMNSTNFTLTELNAAADRASGYQLNNERKLVPDPFESFDAAGPAGSMNSTARDLVPYIRMMLAGGVLDGKRVLDEADVKSMMQPHFPIGPDTFDDVFSHNMYGMGLMVYSYRGIEVAEHGGNMPGAAALILFAPKQKVGIAVLTNRAGAVLRDGLPFEILDRLLGMPSAGMIERNAELESKTFAQEDSAKSSGATDRRTGTKPSHELPEYVGRYNHPGYGDITIGSADGSLTLTYNGFSAKLEHWHFDVFQTPEDRASRLDRQRLQFQTDFAGDVSSLVVPFEPRLDPIVFKRLPPTEMMERAFLERFVGKYDVRGNTAEVRLRENGTLEVVTLGRGEELIPVQGTTFRYKNLTGVSVEFLSGPDGTVDRVAIYANGENSVAPRKK